MGAYFEELRSNPGYQLPTGVQFPDWLSRRLALLQSDSVRRADHTVADQERELGRVRASFGYAPPVVSFPRCAMASDAPKLPRTGGVDQPRPIVRIQIAGREEECRPFAENTHAQMVSRRGVCVGASHLLAPSQRLVVRNLDNGKEAACRVVGQLAFKAAGRVYAVAFLDPNPNFWDIHFAPPQDSGRADGRVLLRCVVCQHSDAAYVDELEALVLKADSRLSRHCQGCGKLTLCRRAEQEVSGQQSTAPAPVLPSRSREGRKATRVKTRLAACIRHREFGEEVAWTVDVSRAGLRFKSAKLYPEGLLIQLALFCSRTGGNIFCPAQIVRAVKSPEESNNEYGVAYLPVYEGQPGSQTALRLYDRPFPAAR